MKRMPPEMNTPDLVPMIGARMLRVSEPETAAPSAKGRAFCPVMRWLKSPLRVLQQRREAALRAVVAQVLREQEQARRRRS